MHRTIGPTGGAIGGGLPLAVGAAVGAPDSKVVAFQADGSSMYTIQSLWTMAREGLNVTVVICNNQRYAILEVERSFLFASQVGLPEIFRLSAILMSSAKSFLPSSEVQHFAKRAAVPLGASALNR